MLNCEYTLLWQGLAIVLLSDSYLAARGWLHTAPKLPMNAFLDEPVDFQDQPVVNFDCDEDNDDKPDA